MENVQENEKRLSAAQYWEWRQTLEELDHSKTKVALSKLKYNFALLECEYKKLKSNGLRNDMFVASENLKAAEKEYSRYKEQLEKDVGASLSNCVIDDITFAVKPLPKEELKANASQEQGGS